ncbi:hypothetical protein HMPREF9505_00380 [Enterococcus faecalis TX0109]|nr:hypothetical protein HMPREF9505_00380 [Enterococcus faecalis TX0109]
MCKTIHSRYQKSLGQKSLWIFVLGLKIDKRREQKQLLRE